MIEFFPPFVHFLSHVEQETCFEGGSHGAVVGESLATFCSGSFIYSRIKYEVEEVRASVDGCCPAETQRVRWVAVTLFLRGTCHYSFHFCHFKRRILQNPLKPLRFTSVNSRFCGRWVLGTPRVLPLVFLTCVSIAHALGYETLQRYRR